MTTPHRATPEQWAQVERFVEDCGYDACLLELRDRIADLEAAANLRQQDETENDRRFRACMAAIDNATPEQIRELTQRPAPGTLVQALARITGHQYDARRCIGQVALWLERSGAPAEWVHRLHDESDREMP